MDNLNDTEKFLFGIASNVGMDDMPTIKELDSPDWPYLYSCEELSWACVIPRDLADIWAQLSLETKLAIYIAAKKGSDRISTACAYRMD